MDRLRLWSGTLLSRVKLCRVEKIRDRNGATVSIRKRRYFHSASLLKAAAIVPQAFGTVRGLSLDEWHAWESQLWKKLYAHDLVYEQGQLIFPVLTGEPLSDLLSCEETPMDRKLACVSAAAQSLRTLHQLSVMWPDGARRLFSHADAHAGNVLCSRDDMRAQWFDFETIHSAHLSADWRHADDLRALAYSAASQMSEEAWPDLARSIAQSYATVAVLAQLCAFAEEIAAVSPGVLHFSQAPMEMAKQRRFSRELIELLRS